MITQYIIQMMHHRAIGDDVPYYYKGKTKSGEHTFDYRKNTALRYETQEQATQNMQMLVAANTEAPSDHFSVIAVRCRA